jgi:MFS transporter, FHS family, glucose/mannose:H+ symporter
MVTFGVVLTTLGASLPGVMSQFGIDKAQAGALLALLNFGVLAGSLVFGPIVDRRGHKSLLVFAFAAIIIGLEATAFAPSINFLRGAVVLIGFTGGLLNGAVNALAADVGAEERAATLTFVGGFFGVGAAGVPLVFATLANESSSTRILATIAPLIAIPLVLTVFTNFPPSKQPHGFPVAEVKRLLRDPVLLLMGLILFLQSGMESTIGGWTTTFFAEELDVRVERAPFYLSMFWLGLLLTRLTLGLVLRGAGSVRVMVASIAVSFASVLALVSLRSAAPAGVAVFLLGCGFAAIFPIVFGFVGDRYAQLSGTALSLVMAMALAGGMLLPYVAGVLGDAHGMRVSLLVVPVCLLLQASLLPILSRHRL